MTSYDGLIHALFVVFSAHLMEYFDPSFIKYLTSNYIGCNLFYLLQELDDRLILIHDKKVNLHAVAKVVELALKVLFFISVAHFYCYGLVLQSNGLRLFCSNRSKSLCLSNQFMHSGGSRNFVRWRHNVSIVIIAG